MKISVYSQINLTDNIRQMIEDGVGTIENRFKKDPSCKVTIKKSENNTIKVSVQIASGKYIFRGENVHKALETAFNNALKDIERKLKKEKTKNLMRRYMPEELKYDNNIPGEELSDVSSFITSQKEIKLEPMDLEEAYMQMDLLGHPFFAFINSKTNLINILYKNKNNDEESYGLMQLTR